jgi:hypothetical protein
MNDSDAHKLTKNERQIKDKKSDERELNGFVRLKKISQEERSKAAVNR